MSYQGVNLDAIKSCDEAQIYLGFVSNELYVYNESTRPTKKIVVIPSQWLYFLALAKADKGGGTVEFAVEVSKKSVSIHWRQDGKPWVHVNTLTLAKLKNHKWLLVKN